MYKRFTHVVFKYGYCMVFYINIINQESQLFRYEIVLWYFPHNYNLYRFTNTDLNIIFSLFIVSVKIEAYLYIFGI